MKSSFQKKGRYSSYAPAAEFPHPKLEPEVDAGHFAGRDYCEEGLVRFIRGDYAWAMQDALMVAYARDTRTIASHLIPAMARRAHLHVREPVAPLLADDRSAGEHYEALHSSEHGRPFDWTNGRGPACPITVYHSWHDCGVRSAAA